MIVASSVLTVPVDGITVKTNLLAAAALTTMFPEMADVNVPAVALRAYVPAMFSVRALNVATPLTAAAVRVLPEAKLAEPDFTAMVTDDVFVVTTFPNASVMDAFNAANLVPAVPVGGDVVMSNLLATAGLIVRLPLTPEVKVPCVALRVYVPAVLRVRLLNLAMPFIEVAVNVLPEAKLPGPVFTANVTVALFEVITLPYAS